MRGKVVLFVGLGLICGSLAMAQKPAERATAPAAAQAGGDLADGLAQRLSKELHVKTVVGEAIKVGSVTLIPILMVFLTLVLPHPVNRWINIVVAGFFFLFNLVGLPTYPSLYDKFLLVVSMVFNGVTVWSAWNWA